MTNTKVALVTGGSSGIGAATARELHARGFTVYAAARRLERMRELADSGIRTLYMDVTDDDSLTGGVKTILDEAGRVDVLVNNAGYGSYGALEDVPIDEGRRQVEVNLIGLTRLIQLVTPHMRRNGSGRIINVSSVGGRSAAPFGGWYHATKHAVEGLSDSLRLELKPFGVDVAIIEPGAIDTEWDDIAIRHLLETSGSGAYRAAVHSHAVFLEKAFRRASSPQVVADAIAHAATAARPKIRYTVPRSAAVQFFVKRFLSDRTVDRITMSVSRSMGKGDGK
ncbi:oxidoreductase [Streptomyces sp. NPDC098781]|uniref:oxidoreductase n=1 Tax=Streptomyces sp. NPDC098781 TaxID=3366097 RepID=UPI0038022819